MIISGSQHELERKGLIYKAAYEGWYSVSDEAYYTNSQIREEAGPDGTYKVSGDTEAIAPR